MYPGSEWDDLMDTGSGRVGQFLGSLDVAAVCGDDGCRSLFVHAGLLPKYVPKSGNLTILNAAARDEIRDRQTFGRRGKKHGGLLSAKGPLWYRGLASGQERECRKARETLRLVGANRMVIGHTIQKDGRIRTTCGGLVHMIDVGMSAWLRGGGAKPGVWTCTSSTQNRGGYTTSSYKVSAVYDSGQEVIEQSDDWRSPSPGAELGDGLPGAVTKSGGSSFDKAQGEAEEGSSTESMTCVSKVPQEDAPQLNAQELDVEQRIAGCRKLAEEKKAPLFIVYPAGRKEKRLCWLCKDKALRLSKVRGARVLWTSGGPTALLAHRLTDTDL